VFDTTDLLDLTAALVGVPSESFEETMLVDLLEQALADAPWLTVDRVGDNLVARTTLGRPQRLLLVGHTDTVPANDNATPVIDGDRLFGVGSTDMKGGLAVMLAAALGVPEPVVDVTYVFYAREEVASIHSGLAELIERRPDLLAGDAALLGEPTEATLEAGCQGTLRLRVELAGARAHTARPWMGRNAIHRLAGLLDAVATVPERRPVLDGCEYREALQAVRVEGGVSGNVVPDRAVVALNHRFAPDRTPAEAEAFVRSVINPFIDDGDVVELEDVAPAAPPSLTHPLLERLRTRNDLVVRAKLGWTDVARLATLGIPAANFGPGDATIAHTQGEHLDREPLEATFAAVHDLLTYSDDS